MLKRCGRIADIVTIVCSDLQPEQVKIHPSDIINNVYIHFYIVHYNPIRE